MLRDCPYCDNRLSIFEHFITDDVGDIYAYVQCSICFARSNTRLVGNFATNEMDLNPPSEEPPTLTGGSPK